MQRATRRQVIRKGASLWGRAGVVALLLAACGVAAPVRGLQDADRGLKVRACTSLEQDKTAERKAAQRKKKGRGEGGAGTACLEIHSPALEVQERMQAFVREQRWRVGEEEISESLWSFRMELTAEELLGYAKPDAAPERMEWGSGKAAVLVQTAELSDGYTRTIVSAHFAGYGEPKDALATKRTSWTMDSNGKLEAALINGLRERFGAKR
jgi:hypothetical protein